MAKLETKHPVLMFCIRCRHGPWHSSTKFALGSVFMCVSFLGGKNQIRFIFNRQEDAQECTVLGEREKLNELQRFSMA